MWFTVFICFLTLRVLYCRTAANTTSLCGPLCDSHNVLYKPGRLQTGMSPDSPAFFPPGLWRFTGGLSQYYYSTRIYLLVVKSIASWHNDPLPSSSTSSMVFGRRAPSYMEPPQTLKNAALTMLWILKIRAYKRKISSYGAGNVACCGNLCNSWQCECTCLFGTWERWNFFFMGAWLARPPVGVVCSVSLRPSSGWRLLWAHHTEEGGASVIDVK